MDPNLLIILKNINKSCVSTKVPLSIYKILFKNHFQEGLRIFPFFYLNKGFARFYYGLPCALFNIETNVSFLQIDMKGSDFISLSCDWCSIMNGMIETAKTNLLYDPILSDLLDMPNLNYVSDFLRKCLKNAKTRSQMIRSINFVLKHLTRSHIRCTWFPKYIYNSRT